MSLSTPTLATERLILRPFTDADADDIYALQSDAEVLRYWDSPPWTERAEADRFLERCRTLAEEGSGVRLVLEDKNDGVVSDTWIMSLLRREWPTASSSGSETP